MKRDIVHISIIGILMIAAIIVCTVAFSRKPEEKKELHTVEIELTEPEETTCIDTEKMHDTETATLFFDTEVLTEECEDTGEVVDTSPEPTETRNLYVPSGVGYLPVPMDETTQDAVRAISAEYGVPFELTMAICYVESGFDPYAVSSHGDSGLMQIAPVNHGWLASDLGIIDLFDSVQNVRAGVHILADKIAGSNGDFTVALMKYNRGDAVALEQMSQGIFSTDYTNRVLGKYYEYLNYGG